MKILHVIASLAPRFGGPSKACFEMARAVARLGHDVRILSTNMDGPDDMDVPLEEPVVQDGVTVRTFQVMPPRFWKPSWGLWRALREEIPSAHVVHIHSLYLFHDWVAGDLCRHRGIPYLIRPHGTLDPYIYRRHRLRKSLMDVLFQNRVLRDAAAIHYTTEDEKRLAERYACGAPGVVIPNGIDLQDYRNLPPKGAFRRRHPEIGDRRIVLFLGRINFKKGLDILAEAFSLVCVADKNTHLVIAGPDDDGLGNDLRVQLGNLGLLERVTFTGLLSGGEKLAALNDADVFVLPSHSENFGIAVIEAMACGVPVVVSKHVNIATDIENFAAGEVTDTSVVPVADAVKRVLKNKELAARMAENGVLLVKERYQWAAIAGRLEKTYDTICDGDLPGRDVP